MKEWYSSNDLAGLAGLPKTRAGVNIRAKSKGWKKRRREGRGGGLEYHYSSLPRATLIELGIEKFTDFERLLEMKALLKQAEAKIDEMLKEKKP